MLKNSIQAATYDGDGKMVKKQEYENGLPSAARTIYIGNLLELQLPSITLPNMTPTATLRSATPPTRTPQSTRTPLPAATPSPSVTASISVTATMMTSTVTGTFTKTFTVTKTFSKTPGPSPNQDTDFFKDAHTDVHAYRSSADKH